MSDISLPPQLVALIRQAVNSLWALELLLFVRNNRAASWSIDQLVRELRGSHPMVADLLIDLHRSGLLERAGDRYRYAPARPELEALVDELVRLSVDRPVAVRNAILAAPNSRVQVFADAFRIKKE